MVFFFKQKTAYELRISDWSSDVCSSDLRDGIGGKAAADTGGHADETPGGEVGDIEDVLVLQNAQRRAVSALRHDLAQDRLDDFLDAPRIEEGRAERHDLWAQHEEPAVGGDVAQPLESPQAAPRGRGAQAGARGNFAQGLLRMIPIECMDHRQPPRQRGDELPIFRQTFAPIYWLGLSCFPCMG